MDKKDNLNIQNDMVLTNKECGLVLSDQKEALNVLAMDEEFIKSLIYQKTLKGMQRLFKNRGVILSEEEIDDFIEMVKAAASKTELPEDFFENATPRILSSQLLSNAVGGTLNASNVQDKLSSIADSTVEQINEKGDRGIDKKLAGESVLWL